MSFLSSIGNFIKPIGTSILKAVAPKAAEALKSVVGFGLDSLFQAGTSGLKGLLGGLPLVGPLASGLVDKLAPGLKNLASNFFNGQIDKLLANIVGQPTSRDVNMGPGQPSTQITAPPIQDRGGSIPGNTPTAPSSGSNASTGAGGAGGTNYNGSFPAFPEAPKDPKDLNAQNNYQKQMFEYQQAHQQMMQFWQMMTTTLKAQGDSIKGMIQNLR